MPAKLDIPKGTVFERWTVIKEMPKIGKSRVFKVRCSCENKTIKELSLVCLTHGKSKSCGCYKLEERKARGKILSDKSCRYHPKYWTYGRMVSRCTNSNNQDYEHYGGRGIEVCQEWLLPKDKGIQNFTRWCDKWMRDKGLESLEGLELDRKNNNKKKRGYSPENCRWVTHKDNVRNRRTTKSVTFKGKQITIGELVEKYGIEGLSVQNFTDRIERYGWTIRTALKTPVKKKAVSTNIKG